MTTRRVIYSDPDLGDETEALEITNPTAADAPMIAAILRNASPAGRLERWRVAVVDLPDDLPERREIEQRIAWADKVAERADWTELRVLLREMAALWQQGQRRIAKRTQRNARSKGGKESGRTRSEAAGEVHTKILEAARKLVAEGKPKHELAARLSQRIFDGRQYSARQIRAILKKAEVK